MGHEGQGILCVEKCSEIQLLVVPLFLHSASWASGPHLCGMLCLARGCSRESKSRRSLSWGSCTLGRDRQHTGMNHYGEEQGGKQPAER